MMQYDSSAGMREDIPPSKPHLHLEKESIAKQLEVAQLQLNHCKDVVANRLALRKAVLAGKSFGDELYKADAALDDTITKNWQARLRAAYRKVHRLKSQLS